MNTNSEKVMQLVGGRVVSLTEILDNLKILKVDLSDVRACYFLTRTDKTMPWPAPYEIGEKVDGKKFYCCSFSTLDEEEYPEDTKQLNVYRVDMDD